MRAAVVCWSSTSPSLFDDGEPNEKREEIFFFASRFFFSFFLLFCAIFLVEGGIRAKLRNPPVISSYSCSFSMDATHDIIQRARAASLPPSFFFSVCVFLSTVHGWFGIWRREEMEKMNLFFRYLTRPYSLLLLKLHIYDAREIVSFLTGRERKCGEGAAVAAVVAMNRTKCLLAPEWVTEFL